MAAQSVEAYLEALEPEVRAAVDALRAIVIEAQPGLTERIKWNAPSFAIGDDDRITLGVAPKGGFRVVLHRGVAAKNDGFRLDDRDGLAKWPAPDRGVVMFADAAEIEARRDALLDLFTRWLAATR